MKGLPWAARTKGQRRWTPSWGGRAHGEATSSEARDTENQRVSPRAAHGTRLLVDEMSMSVRILSLFVAHVSACLPAFRHFFWQNAEAASRTQARMLTRRRLSPQPDGEGAGAKAGPPSYTDRGWEQRKPALFWQLQPEGSLDAVL